MKKISLLLFIGVPSLLVIAAWMLFQSYGIRDVVLEKVYTVGNTRAEYQERLLKSGATGDMFEAVEALRRKGWEKVFSEDTKSNTIAAESTLLTREDCTLVEYVYQCPYESKDPEVRVNNMGNQSFYRDGKNLVSILPTVRYIGDEGVLLYVYLNEKKVAELVGFTGVSDGYVRDVRSYKNSYMITYTAWDKEKMKPLLKAYYFDEKERLHLGDHEPRGTFLYKNKVGYISAETSQIYLDQQPVSPEFDSISLYACCASTPMPYAFNEKKGTLDFVAERDHNLYLVHIAFIDQ